MSFSKPLRAVSVALAFQLSLGAAAASDVVLDKLNACAEIERLRLNIDSSAGYPVKQCRSPSSELETLIWSSAPSAVRGRCLMQEPPSPWLEGFACSLTIIGKARQLVCFREASLESVEEYKRHFRSKYEAPTRAYIAEASQCEVSNGDASSGTESLIPQPLAQIAKNEISFSMLLDGKPQPDSQVVHAFASIDPLVAGSDGLAIEYVSMLLNGEIGQPATPEQGQTIGSWMMRMTEEPVAKSAEAQGENIGGLPFVHWNAEVSLTRSYEKSLSGKDKVQRLRTLKFEFVELLEEMGLQEIDRYELEEMLGGVSLEDVLDSARAAPYGWRQKGGEPIGETRATMLIGTAKPWCRGSSGALLALVTVLPPPGNSYRDHGQIGVTLAAAGACAQAADAFERFTKNVRRRVEEEVAETLRYAD